MGIGIGDTLTVNLLGRDIEARIANLRDIDWSTLGINFVIVFAPGALEDAPQTHLATVRVDRADEAAVEKSVTDLFPNVSAIRVREALEAVNTILTRLGSAVRAVAFVTLLAGALALAGTIAARHERRVYEAVVLKVLGARRRDLMKAFLAEYGLVGPATAALAIAIGVPAGAIVLTRLMHMDFVFLPGPAAVAVVLGVAACLAFGFAGTWIALGESAPRHLRNE
jgi:putative ABC transport system permease protein